MTRYSKQIVCWCTAIRLLSSIAGAKALGDEPFERLDYRVELDTVLTHDDGSFLWYHPRATPLSSPAQGISPVVMTLQKHLHVSDYYSGLYVMRTTDLGRTWSMPEAPPELAWVREPDGVTIGVADVTPGWHAPTGKVLAVGARVRYSPRGEQLADQKRAHQTAYATYDPKSGSWSRWRVLELPSDGKFDFAYSACAQWLAQDDGTVLLPLYFGKNVGNSGPHAVTVARCTFDGDVLKYLRHGDEIELPTERGLCEPSLAHYRGRYYLTIRHDLGGYVVVGNDGFRFAALTPWRFEDGADLGSYNTQQHWLTHSDGLFLVYTRRGADNDHIPRHRAPLFIAQVNPATLRVERSTERVLIPERGAELGNFGASAIDKNQSWVTVSEGIWDDSARLRGAKGATFVARIVWSKPNSLVTSAHDRGKPWTD